MIERSVAAASKAARICWGVADTSTTDPDRRTTELGRQVDDDQEHDESSDSDLDRSHFVPPRLPSLGARNFA